LQTLSQTSAKGANFDAFLRYVQAMKASYTCLWSTYTRSKWTDRALRLYRGNKRTFTKLFHCMQTAIAKDKTLKVSYGPLKFVCNGQSKVCVPTSLALKEGVGCFYMRHPDEFRMTVLHHEMPAFMKGFGRCNMKHRARDLQWCYSTNQTKCTFVNRDHNTTINIVNCML